MYLGSTQRVVGWLNSSVDWDFKKLIVACRQILHSKSYPMRKRTPDSMFGWRRCKPEKIGDQNQAIDELVAIGFGSSTRLRKLLHGRINEISIDTLMESQSDQFYHFCTFQWIFTLFFQPYKYPFVYSVWRQH